MNAEATLELGYALFLIAAALGLDAMARQTHHRSGRFRTAGFDYHAHLDAWECPEGQHLHRAELDHERRQVRYRGKAHVCNACPAKGDCTDSDQGREIVRPLDPWPHSEAGRFHRGISLAMLTVAVLVSLVGLFRSRSPLDTAVLSAGLLLAIALLLQMASAFRAMPANFPGAGGPARGPG